MTCNNKLPLIYIASDHAGFLAKQFLVEKLQSNGYQVKDFGPTNCDPVDYPDYAFLVANAVAKAKNGLGILVCGSGVGVCVAANKVKNVIAALVYSPKLAALARQHDHANVLCLSGRYVSNKKNWKIAQIFLTAAPEGGRHQRRVNKILQYCPKKSFR